MSSFPERLKELRTKNKITQFKLAKEINITDRACRRYEAGENEPTMSILVALADYFNISVDYLIGRSEDPKRY